MNVESWQLFSLFGFFIIMLFIAGAYCLIVTRNLIRAVIGLELLIKAVTLLIIVVGYVTGRIALMQALVITIVVIEVVIVAMAGGLILSIFNHNGTLDERLLKRLKG